MPEVTLRGAVDTWVNANRPTRNYGDSRKLGIASGEALAYIYFNRPMPPGAIVTSATLRLYHAGSWSGTSTVSVHRLSEQLRASRATWNNRPGVTGGAATASDTGGGDGKLVEVDVQSLMQPVADGGVWHGFRVSSSSAALRQLWSTEGASAYRPTLTVEWSEAPQAPTNLTPNGEKAAPVAKPLVRFQVTDTLGDTTLGAVRVQVGPTADFTGAWDSGWVDADLPQLDLASTTYPGITQGSVVYWRVQVRDGAGLESEWSDDAAMTYVPHATVSILNPAGATLADPTPRILWSSSGVQTRWQVLVLDAADTSLVLADSGEQSTAETAWSVPTKKALQGAGPFRVEVRLWDDVSRTSTDPYAVATRDFTVTNDPTVAVVTSLAASQPNPWPGVVLTWDRDTAPDSYVIVRDGDEVVEADLLPEDALVSGTSYQWTDPGARVWRPHTWQVKAKVNEAQSDSVGVVLTPKTRGIWLVDEVNDRRVWLAGNDGGTWNRPEQATAITPIGGTQTVRRVQGVSNYEGTLNGHLVDAYDRTRASYEADLEAMRKNPGVPVFLTVADLTLKVLLGNVQTQPTQHIPPSRLVGFDFWEVS